jgi:hypothetical protein
MICAAAFISYALVVTPPNGLHTEISTCFSERPACESAAWMAGVLGGSVIERCTPQAAGDPDTSPTVTIRP